MKRVMLFTLGLIFVAIMWVSSCSPQPSNLLYCPINYDQLGEECKINQNGNPDPSKWEQVEAVNLQVNQVGIFRQPGDRPVTVVEGIGYHAVPAKYTQIYPTNLRTYRTERDPASKCTADMVSTYECNTSLDNVRLKGGTEATIDFEIDYRVLVNTHTASNIHRNFTSYAVFMDKFNRYIRSGFRSATGVDPALYSTGDINSALIAHYTQWVKDWQFAQFIELGQIRVRSIEIQGIDTSSRSIRSNQGEQNAIDFATQSAIACGEYESEVAKTYCTAIYVWSQKQDGSSAPLPLSSDSTPVTPESQ